MDKIKVGIIGLGTVGSGVVKTLKEFDNIEIIKIAVKNLRKDRNIPGLNKSILTDNPYDVVNSNETQIVVEVIGGITENIIVKKIKPYEIEVKKYISKIKLNNNQLKNTKERWKTK